MGRSSALLRVVGLLTLGLLASGADAQAPSAGLPAPKGLSSCPPGNREAVLGRVAAELGAEIVGCFQSEKRIMVQGSIMPVPMPLELAFAMELPGGPYTSADVDKLLSRTMEKWKDFQPLSKQFENYTLRLNELINSAEASPSVAVSSVKPVLVSIDRVGAKGYSVVQIRHYVIDVGGEQVSFMKVDGNAVVLRGSGLIRLTIQRMLTDPSDVAQLQGEIAEWARTTAASY
jgi:hypothetical protein